MLATLAALCFTSDPYASTLDHKGLENRVKLFIFTFLVLRIEETLKKPKPNKQTKTKIFLELMNRIVYTTLFTKVWQ